MPGTFEAGVDVVVIGEYASNGSLITAEQLQTKCPSKYEGQASPAAQQ
jgi:cytochrome c-type biogenesis protein CcmE